MLKLIKLFLAVVFLVIGAAFAIINDQPVMVDLYLYTPTMPLSLLLLLGVGSGIVLGAIVSSFYFMRVRKENADLRRQPRQVEREIKNLHSLPANSR
mgnify:CR=1 FL=1